MQVVAVRLTAEELDALDAAAAKNDMSRSEAIVFGGIGRHPVIFASPGAVPVADPVACP